MKQILKLLAVGAITTCSRFIAQMLIPACNQDILSPSKFCDNGTMPMILSIYGIFTYTIIASLYLIVRDQLSGNRWVRGMKYGAACSTIWIIYLLEPLPHVKPLERIQYPLANGFAFLVMGIALSLLLTERSFKPKRTVQLRPTSFHIKMIISVAGCFFVGRLIQYLLFDIYSSFFYEPVQTLLWVVVTGICIGLIMRWFEAHITDKCAKRKLLLLGGALFGLNLLLFNFFLPIFFQADLVDLLVRSILDIGAVRLGLLLVLKSDQPARLT
ncbi:hypothetical protein RE628_07015 [Paenibacillus sp. D2_2]|uniref:hypothetical protein n=1 Tax=Paenibacillus sp. D2_2 TaxID=3073092 RepID=UPI002815A598|nr:hypothetical protein [Paenibacillus sp. D2_2]WMT42162.1 hypothetical protein RE628_07015 [Paenibacillus sp. D2_2]